MLRLKGGHFIGHVDETDGAGAINETYYATFEDLIENVNKLYAEIIAFTYGKKKILAQG